MISRLYYALRIVLPGLVWTGGLSILLSALILYGQFRLRDRFTVAMASSIAEQFFPVLSAFMAAGVLEHETRRGVQEILCTKRRSLVATAAERLVVALALSLILGAGLLAVMHFGIRPIPMGTLLLAAIPPSFCTAALSLWTRVRFGNAFMGYTVALTIWMANLLTSVMGSTLGISVNPLLTFSSYTDWLQAVAIGEEAVTPYVDWWWAPKIALMAAGSGLFVLAARRVEHRAEGE